MEIKLYDPSQLLSHVLLADRDLCVKVSETIKKENSNKSITATVFFNGIECKAEILENAMVELFNQIDRKYIEKYQDIENAVCERAKSIVKEKAEKLMDSMQELQCSLDNVEDIIDN